VTRALKLVVTMLTREHGRRGRISDRRLPRATLRSR